jgi:hypothetical protein
MFLQRYDTTEFKGWGSANDMTGKELGAKLVGTLERLKVETFSKWGERSEDVEMSRRPVRDA